MCLHGAFTQPQLYPNPTRRHPNVFVESPWDVQSHAITAGLRTWSSRGRTPMDTTHAFRHSRPARWSPIQLANRTMCSLTAGPAHAGHPRGRRHCLRAPPPALCRRFELHRSVGLYRRYARQLKPACAPSLLMKLLNARSNHVNARRYHWHRCCRHCRRVFQAFAATLALLHFSHASRAGSKTWLYFEREPLAWCKACRCALYDHPVQMCRGSPVCAAALPSNGRLPHRLSASVRTPGIAGFASSRAWIKAGAAADAPFLQV